MILPNTQLIFWNALGSMLKKWKGRGIPKARCYNLLRLWLGYEFTDLMDEKGCFDRDKFYSIRQKLGCKMFSVIADDISRSRSFFMFADETGKMVRFCSPIWHTPEAGNGTLMPGSYVMSSANQLRTSSAHHLRTSSAALNNENNKKPQKEEKEEKGVHSTGSVPVFRDVWAEGFAAHYPTLAKMKHPLSEEEYAKVLEKGYRREAVMIKLQRMENYPNVEKKYSSCYLTLLDWLRN